MTTEQKEITSAMRQNVPLSDGLDGCNDEYIDILTETAPELIWLQIDTDDLTNDRSEPFPPLEGDGVTWCWERIGGQEVEYVRADLVRAALPMSVLQQEQDDPVLYRLAKLLGIVPPNVKVRGAPVGRLKRNRRT